MFEQTCSQGGERHRAQLVVLAELQHCVNHVLDICRIVLTNNVYDVSARQQPSGRQNHWTMLVTRRIHYRGNKSVRKRLTIRLQSGFKGGKSYQRDTYIQHKRHQDKIQNINTNENKSYSVVQQMNQKPLRAAK